MHQIKILSQYYQNLTQMLIFLHLNIHLHHYQIYLILHLLIQYMFLLLHMYDHNNLVNYNNYYYYHPNQHLHQLRDAKAYSEPFLVSKP